MKQITLFTLCISFLFSGQAQVFQQTAGLGSSGSVEALHVNGDLILASINSKLYRSTDAGQSFDYVAVDEVEVNTRCFAQIDDVIVLGGIDGDRIYRSTDDGLTWTSSWTGSPDIFGFPAAVPIAVDALNGAFYMCGTGFIRKSSDLGLTWDIMDIDGLCLDVSSTNGEIWATPGGNLHRSLDEGLTWLDVPDDGFFFDNASVDVHISGSRIFVATSLSAGNGLYMSEDDGLNYSPIGGFNVGRNLLEVNSTLYLTHFDGASKSIDNGETWEAIDGLPGFYSSNGDMSFDGVDKIWFASASGLYWYDINTGEVGSYPFPVGMVEEVTLSTNSLFGMQGGSLFQSVDAGASWMDITSSLDSEAGQVYDVFADGLDVYVIATVDFTPTYFYSSDEGQTFESISLGGTVGFVNQVLSFNPVVLAANNGVYISNDNGQTYQQANLLYTDGSDADDNFQVQDIVQNENSIFLRGPQGMVYSHDMGNSWTLINEPSTVQFAGWPDRLVRNRSNSFPPYVTEESTDGGDTWIDVAGMPTQFTGPEFMWMMNDTLFLQNDQAAGQPGQIFYLAEGDAQWQESASYGALPDQIISVESDADGRVFLGTRSSGAWLLSPGIVDSVEDLEIASTRIYPNPALEQIHVESLDHRLLRITIYNVLGTPVLMNENNFNNIDVSELKSGTYLMILETEGGIQNHKFLKQ